MRASPSEWSCMGTASTFVCDGYPPSPGGVLLSHNSANCPQIDGCCPVEWPNTLLLSTFNIQLVTKSCRWFQRYYNARYESTVNPARAQQWTVMMWTDFWGREERNLWWGKTCHIQPSSAGIQTQCDGPKWLLRWLSLKGWARVRDCFCLIKGTSRLSQCCLFPTCVRTHC